MVLRVLSTGETSRLAYAAGRVFLTVYAVPSAEREEIERALLDHGLPLLRSWLERVEAAGSTWRTTNHSFVLRYADGALNASSD